MNQQQLQIARTALWHQTAPLLTADEATAWLEDLGLCLFLPRHAQLPAPAPSFVEAVHGAASAAPPAAALEHASELTARLVDDDRVVPLNLLGTYSEQADFLITPEVLPWVAAVRGDRQWTAAPGGHTSPLVVRTWQTLDREGEATAVQVRELLGRELTEGAVLRALIELWTTVRAMPVYKRGEPTRWTLLKHRFPAQLTTGANTAQATALSALLSIYLRSAVAATAEEAEIFLSPLTARSRIREVIHGMTAARHFGSMSVASQTLLFVEGSLPENLPAEEPETAAPVEKAPRAPRPPFRREFQDKRRTSRPPGASARAPRRPIADGRPEKRADARPRETSAWERRPALRRPERPAPTEGAATESRPGARETRPSTGFRPGARGEKRPGAKPWERRPAFRRPERPAPKAGASTESRPGARSEKRPSTGFRPGPRGEKRPGAKPWERRPAFRRPERPAPGERASAESRPGARGEERPGTGFRTGPRGEKRPGARPWERRPAFRRSERPAPGGRASAESRPGTRGDKRPGTKPWERRPASGTRGEERPRPGRSAGDDRRPRFEGERSPNRKFGQKFENKSGQKFGQKGGFRPSSPNRFGEKKPGAKPFGGPRPKFPPKREEGGAAAGGPAEGGDRRPRFRKPSAREDSARPSARGKDYKGPGKKNFRKANPGERNPRKNRSQEEKPE
ncbi:MAG: hypothetical protein WBW84_06520 [Acidobacteriaceae bacterium]